LRPERFSRQDDGAQQATLRIARELIAIKAEARPCADRVAQVCQELFSLACTTCASLRMDFFPSCSADAPAPPPRCLVVGPEGCGKTSLLLQYAYALAARERTSLFVCRRERLAASPPVRPRDDAATPEVDEQRMRHIRIKYVASIEALQELLTSLHLGEAPHALLLDDLFELCTPSATDGEPVPPRHPLQAVRAASVAALAATAVDWMDAAHGAAANTLGGSPPPACSLVVAATRPQPNDCVLMSRWMPGRLELEQSPPTQACSGGPPVFTARLWSGASDSGADAEWATKYTHTATKLALYHEEAPAAERGVQAG